MASLEDDEDAGFAYQRVPGRFYISRSFPYEGHGEENDLDGKTARFAYAVAGDNAEEVVFEDDGGWEVVLRETGRARQQLKAIFFEDGRKVPTLAFQRFKSDGAPIRVQSFSLHGDEVEVLRTFLGLIDSPNLDLGEDAEDDRIRVSPEMAKQMLADSDVLEAFVKRNPQVIAAVMQSEVSAPEVVAIARRKEVLNKFEDLLYKKEAFEAESKRLGGGGREKVWQTLIEDNPWLIGVTVAPQFVHALERGGLEQSVFGASIVGAGKRPDAVLRTVGAVSSLVLVEIKHHETSLLSPRPYRSGCWAVDAEVVGGVSQCQASAQLVERHVGDLLEDKDEAGFTRGLVRVCRPRTVLVVGSLEQFRDGNVIHPEKFESFERFRRGMRDPEILTFDELYERARLSVMLTEEAQERCSTSNP